MLAPLLLRRYAFHSLRLCTALGLGFVMGALAPAGLARADEVELSNLTDVNVPQWVTGEGDIVQDVFVCVYRQNSSGTARTYGIEATGDGPGFYLKSGTTTLAYSVNWYDGGTGSPGGGSGQPLVNNVVLTAQTNARNNQDLPVNSADCNGGGSPTAMLRLSITATDMDAAPDGTYSGTLTLLLSLT
jgi:hypothetical protein